MMLCPNCGKANGFIARFCQNCGTSLPETSGYSQPGIRYAGFWRRLAAYMIDYIFITIAAAVSVIVLGIMFAPPGFGWHIGWDYRLILGPIVPWLYWSILESSIYQATFGKMIMGIVVTDSRGRRITFRRATVRYWSKFLSALLLLAGFVMIGFTSKREGLHDMIAGSLVIRR
ncbi:MAG TPA: RDD family protein [Methanotrichaceae archaeon]|nr:RDD family protein [Methanotrichaceae archaeon]